MARHRWRQEAAKRTWQHALGTSEIRKQNTSTTIITYICTTSAPEYNGSAVIPPDQPVPFKLLHLRMYDTAGIL